MGEMFMWGKLFTHRPPALPCKLQAPFGRPWMAFCACFYNCIKGSCLSAFYLGVLLPHFYARSLLPQFVSQNGRYSGVSLP